MQSEAARCATKACVRFTANTKVNSFGFSSFMFVIVTWESVLTFIADFKVRFYKKKTTAACFPCMKAPDLCCHFTLNIIPDRCSPQHFLPLRALRNRLPHADGQALIIASLQQQTKLLNLYSPLDFIILLLHLPSLQFSSPAGSRHGGGLAGLVRENLQPDATICYVANAWCSSSFTFQNAPLCIVNVLLAFMKVFTCIHKPRCRYLSYGIPPKLKGQFTE